MGSFAYTRVMNKDNAQTVEDLIARIRIADEHEFASLQRSLSSDTRVTVQRALDAARKRIDASRKEHARLASLYHYQNELAQGRIIVGLDEVGRGPLAGPLTIGAVVLDPTQLIDGLNDSKQIPEAKRFAIAQAIKEQAIAYSLCHISPEEIDSLGMSASLKKAFSTALADIDARVENVGAVLIDGNPLHIDAREINVIKGDAKCASIAAASILAKVERDSLMCDYAQTYPEYGFESNKGYASSKHQEAIRSFGLCPIHRKSFCTSFLQQSLF